MTRTRDWLQLCRLPNVFTAIADPLAGALIAGATWLDSPYMVIAAIASACLYTGGMILNDWNDYKVDLRERPQRPLPSGRIRRSFALLAATVLLVIGPALAFLAGESVGNTAIFLAIAIVSYDVLLKDLPIAPAVMGICRGLNLLMGMMVVPVTESHLNASARFILFVIMAAYITGVTLFARREARQKQTRQLQIGALVTWAALLFLAFSPVLFKEFAIQPAGYAWLALLFLAVGYRMSQALFTPQPKQIQIAVKTAIMGIIVLDAALVGFARGIVPSACILLLLIPALWLGKWLYST